MAKIAQANFSKRVRVALINTEQTVSQLAKKIRRPRPTVSRVIHGKDFPRVRKQIAKELAIDE